MSIPSGCDYVSNSLTIDGNVASSVTDNGSEIKVSVNSKTGVIRFNAKPLTYGKLNTTAKIYFKSSGVSLYEMIGSIDVTVPYITLTSVTKTESRDITVSGLCVPDEYVAIYDGDIRIGTAKSGASGKWSKSVTLYGSEGNTIHTLTAKVFTGTDNEIESTPVSVLYDPASVTVKEFIMYYNGSNKVNLTEASGGKKQIISFNPAYAFTFTVKLSDNKAARNVNIVSMKGTEIRKIAAVYDEGSDMWIAKGYFDSNHSYVPGVLSVEYDGVEKDYYVDISKEIPVINKEDLPVAYEFTSECERCVDPFHVVEWAMEALDEVRRESWRDAHSEVKALEAAHHFKIADMRVHEYIFFLVCIKI